MLTWLPFSLVHERHLPMRSMVTVATAYYTIDAVSALVTGWLADLCIRHGYSTTLVRKSAMAVGHSIAAAAVLTCVLANSHWHFGFLFAIGIGEGVAGAGTFAFSQTLAGPYATGKWSGLQNGFANLAGIVAPALTGFLVDRTGSFLVPLTIVALVLVAGAISWLFVVGCVEQVSWKSPVAGTFGRG